MFEAAFSTAFALFLVASHQRASASVALPNALCGITS
jgi:hypothetical protein